MDQFDEFEIKPLTAGLGFHKKPVTLKDHVAKAGLSREKTSRMPMAAAVTGDALEGRSNTTDMKPRSKEQILNEIKEALKPVARANGNSRLTETLPRGPEDVRASALGEMEVPKPSSRTPMDIVNFEIPNQSINEKNSPSVGARRGGHDTKMRELVPIPFSFASTILDSVIVLALSLIFMMSLVFVTGVDLVAVIASASREGMAQMSLVVLYLAVWQMYVVVARSVFGASIGEWTFDLQLGDKNQIADTLYPAKVLLRSLAVMFTGFLLLPVLSIISRRDVASKVSGLQLFRKNI